MKDDGLGSSRTLIDNSGELEKFMWNERLNIERLSPNRDGNCLEIDLFGGREYGRRFIIRDPELIKLAHIMDPAKNPKTGCIPRGRHFSGVIKK